MKYIAHRVNTLAELRSLPQEYGAEIDLRDRGDRLILQHDPFKDGEDFEPFLNAYRHGTLILNVKSERIEYRVLDLLRKQGIEDYLFLDSSFPMIHALSGEGETRIALRYSEFEGLDTVLAMKGRVGWVWVDCFTKLPLDRHACDVLRKNNFRTCLVSPELQGREDDIIPYRDAIDKLGIALDAVCTKKHNILKWAAR